MSEKQFRSIHLEGQQRRELFRQARARLEACCGSQTIGGDLRQQAKENPAEVPTQAFNPNAQYCLKDGDKLYKLAIGVNSVGRLPDNSIVIADDHVSRRHCAVIVHSDGRCEIHDIASKNGTLVNGKRLSGPTPLAAGDQITLCGKSLELVDTAAR